VTDAPKRIGVLRDPWRTNVPEFTTNSAGERVDTATGQRRPVVPTVSQEAARDTGDDINDDMEGTRQATIELKNYGGVTVKGAASSAHAAAQILKYCVDNSAAIDKVLTRYGLVVTKLHPGQLKAPFYIQRQDGWTLAIPMARTRDEGCLQLIQALLAIRVEIPAHTGAGARMDEMGIAPFKM
jgi:hypothetical protein